MSDVSLKNKRCIPCEGGVPPLEQRLKEQFKNQIHSDWSLENNKRLQRTIRLKGFKLPIDISCEIGKLADDQWHHPELHISFNQLKIEIWTHKIGDLVESDFIFAAKVDEILEKYE